MSKGAEIFMKFCIWVMSGLWVEFYARNRLRFAWRLFTFAGVVRYIILEMNDK